jgi:acyl phosphate:glycerol-3-phosphate acyltransferase
MTATSDRPGAAGADGRAHPTAGPRRAAWLLVVTGAGLRGARERELVRRLGDCYGEPVPVEVHHYGVFRSGALFRWCQRIATRRLARRLRDGAARGQPDIVAHSFGAWLVGHALAGDADLRVGRVILVGSVLRPDFDWGPLIAGGRVEAVLNHHGRRDLWARASHYFIPDSGPSGHRGFAGIAVVNHPAPGFGHTTFFEPDAMDEIHPALWRPFLTRPVPTCAPTGAEWRPAPWVLRTLPRVAIVLAAMAGVAALGAGVVDLVTGPAGRVALAGALALAYLIGSIPLSQVVARTRGVDLAVVGSRAVSPSNLYRTVGRWPAIIAGALELAKGALAAAVPVALGRPGLAAAAGALAVAGHNWSPFLRGAGGRGLSPATGALMVACWPGAAVMCLGLAVGTALRRVIPAMGFALVALVPVVLLTRGPAGAIAVATIVTPIGVKTAVLLRRRRLMVRALAGSDPTPGLDPAGVPQNRGSPHETTREPQAR